MGQEEKTSVQNINIKRTYSSMSNILKQIRQQNNIPRIQKDIIRPWPIALFQPRRQYLRSRVHD